MDAINPREIIAMSIRNGGRANSYNKALYAISDLEANGYQIIHRDENHGPTLERAADFCWSKRDLLADAEKKQIEAGLTGRDYYGRRLEAELLSRAIRAMGEKK